MTWQTRAMQLAGLIVVTMISTGQALAQPALTTIQDTLYKADASPFEGVLLINWRTFEGPDASNIPTNSLTVRVVNGILYTKLVPTTTASHAAYYSVRYVADGAVAFTELWSVPESDTPLKVANVRVNWPPLPGDVAEPGTTVEITDVNGLPEALDARPVKGLGYLSSRAAVISGAGELEAASGSLSDCIRVDGTSGACGSGSGSAPVWVDAETPSGAIDGSNDSFTLASTPNPSSSVRIYRNGVLLFPTVDYTLSGTSITMLSGAIPQTGDDLVVYYRTQ